MDVVGEVAGEEDQHACLRLDGEGLREEVEARDGRATPARVEEDDLP